MVGDPEQRDDHGAGGHALKQPADIRLGRPATQRQHAAMDREADDPVHHRRWGEVDRRLVRQGLQQRPQRRQAILGDQGGGHRMPAAGARPGPQHHLALGHEAALAADQIALAHLAIALDARVVRVVDADEGGHGHGLAASLDAGKEKAATASPPWGAPVRGRSRGYSLRRHIP